MNSLITVVVQAVVDALNQRFKSNHTSVLTQPLGTDYREMDLLAVVIYGPTADLIAGRIDLLIRSLRPKLLQSNWY